MYLISYGPRQANLVLIAYASSEGSGEPAHLRSLPEPSLLAHTSSESRGTFRQKARSLAPLNSWACAVKIYHDGMLEDTNLLDGAHMQDHQNAMKVKNLITIGNLHFFQGLGRNYAAPTLQILYSQTLTL